MAGPSSARSPQLADYHLARRLERTEARACASFVEARARVEPQSGAEWIDVSGTYAMFDAPHSPITQTFGLGMFAPACDSDLDTIERFFRERGAAIAHEVSPLGDKATMPLLCERGYRPIEFTSVMFLPLPRSASLDVPDNVQVRRVGPDETELWARTAAEGWRERLELSDTLLELSRITAARPEGSSFIAEIEHHPVASGALSIHDGVALFAGASTIPEFRKLGGQRALLSARFEYAEQCGCDLAMLCAEPGSASQRNAERHGFRIAYTRIKWELPAE